MFAKRSRREKLREKRRGDRELIADTRSEGHTDFES